MSPFNVILVTLLLLLVYGNCNTAPTIIIIGAGAAGIAAATRLLENGINNITILEAEGRIGGRIHTIQFGDNVVDLGAQWCHGEDNNVVYQLVKDFDLLAEPTNSSTTIYSSSSKKLDENFANELSELCEEIYEEEKPDEEISLGQYIINKYNNTVREKYGNDEEKLKLAWDILNTYKNEVLAMEGAFSWFDVAANGKYEECEGNQYLHWKEKGFKTILDVLMKSYPDTSKKLPIDDKILLKKEVNKIVWDSTTNNKNGVTVKCSDDSKYTADHVILTVSLGVFKEQSDTLFDPQLPQDKIDAIKELGLGAVIKVFLHFSEKWWKEKEFANILCWQEKDREGLLQEFSKGPNKNGRSWLEHLYIISTIEENPNVLITWFTGEFVPQIELLSDEIIIDGVMFVLNKFMGHQFNITKPTAILRSNWYTNPHFRGVYSFETVKSSKNEISGVTTLAKPLTSSNGKQTLLFAGEATNSIHYSTVHGAIETGYREADRIINFYK